MKTMPETIRLFDYSDSDYDALVALWNATNPDMLQNRAEWQFSDKNRDKKYLYQRFLIEQDGAVVGSCTYQEPSWSYQKGKFSVGYMLAPAYLDTNLHQAAYDFLMEKLSTYEVTTLITLLRENHVERLAFLKKQGFKQVQRGPVSHLDAPGFDPAPYEGLVQKLTAEGIEIISAVEWQKRDPAWLRKWYDLRWELLQDIPTPDELTRISWESFIKMLESPNYLQEALFFAFDGDTLVGTSGLWRPPADETLLITGLTGTVRSYRRRGIATAMKVRGIQFAKQYGAERIETDNEENNPMYQINMKLGYKPAPAWLDLEKKIAGGNNA